MRKGHGSARFIRTSDRKGKDGEMPGKVGFWSPLESSVHIRADSSAHVLTYLRRRDALDSEGKVWGINKPIQPDKKDSTPIGQCNREKLWPEQFFREGVSGTDTERPRWVEEQDKNSVKILHTPAKYGFDAPGVGCMEPRPENRGFCWVFRLRGRLEQSWTTEKIHASAKDESRKSRCGLVTGCRSGEKTACRRLPSAPAFLGHGRFGDVRTFGFF
ncbi:hypothetical protein DFH06DRAFT_1122716 [Mycena polygramma]|nr:hypothetical protein DFH06DRAFT_1122716 [Mycena polygramma]